MNNIVEVSKLILTKDFRITTQSALDSALYFVVLGKF